MARRRRDGQSGEAEPCSAQLGVGASEGGANVELICPESFRGLLERLVRLLLSAFEIFRQVSIIIFVRTNHYQLEIITDESIRKKILYGVYLEFVDKDTSESTLFLLSDRWVCNDLANLIVENPFFLFSKSSDLFFE